MRLRLKKLVWNIYRIEYKFFHNDKEPPSTQISLCKMSWSVVGLGIAMLVALCVVLLFMVALEIGGILVAMVGWFMGFSPRWKKWLKFGIADGSTSEELWDYKSSDSSYSYSYYRVSGHWAPWQFVLFPIPILGWLWSRTLGPVLSPAGDGIMHLIHGAKCPVPLDFSDVAPSEDEEEVPASDPA